MRKLLLISMMIVMGFNLYSDVVPVVVGGLLATPLVHSLCYL